MWNNFDFLIFSDKMKIKSIRGVICMDVNKIRENFYSLVFWFFDFVFGGFFLGN